MTTRALRAGAMLLAAILLLRVLPARANHGPGTSGGGSATASGETLKAGAFELSLREDYTRFRQVDAAQAEAIAMKSGEFDAIQESYLTTASLAYGIIDDLQECTALLRRAVELSSPDAPELPTYLANLGGALRLAIEGREIQVFGDGRQVRDFVYVDDAVDAFLRAGASEASNGQVFNVGGFEPITHKDLVHLLIATAGSGSYRLVEWPPDKKAIDIGDFYADWTLIGDTLGWRPQTTLADGLKATVAFYREHLEEYVAAPGGAAIQ